MWLQSACACLSSSIPLASSLDEPLGASASLGGRLAEPRGNESLLLEPLQRHVDRPARRASPCPLLELLENGGAVCPLSKVEDGQHDQPLELSCAVLGHETSSGS